MIKKITSDVSQFCFEKFGSCVYLLDIDGKNILIDSSSEDNREELIDDLRESGLSIDDIDVVLLTHKHWDHSGNLEIFKNAKVYGFDNIDEFYIKGMDVIKVPGHTKDSLAFLYKGILFSGDTLFHNGIGRTDLPESEPEKIEGSLDLLRSLDYDVLCPGHL